MRQQRTFSPRKARAHLRPWRWACAGALLGVVCMIVCMAPAQWLAQALAQATAQHLLLTETQGTVWSGSARLLLSSGQDGRDATALPSRVHWQLRPRWLGADVQLHSACCTQGAQPLQLRLRQSFSGTQLQVADAQMQLPSALLSGLGTPWNTLQPEGQLSLGTQALRVHLAHQRAEVQGSVRLVLAQACTRLSTIRPIGSYEIVLRSSAQAPGRGAPLEISLSSLPGSSLLLSGSGQWTGGRLHFLGEARATPERAEALANLLNIIGRRDGARSVISLG